MPISWLLVLALGVLWLVDMALHLCLHVRVAFSLCACPCPNFLFL